MANPHVYSSNFRSTTHLLCEQQSQKDYAASFGVLADAYGFGAPYGASCAPPPSPVHVIRSWPSTSSSSLPSTADPKHSLRGRLIAFLKSRYEPITQRGKKLLRRSAPNLRSLVSATRKPRDVVDKVQRARNYDAAFTALQAEHGYIIGSAMPEYRYY